jgi:CDGSH-type Zn-finger protein
MSTKITVRKNGPFRIEGDFILTDPDGNVYGLGGKARISLCRCGASGNKPFCDDTHKSCGFEDAGTARDLEPAA